MDNPKNQFNQPQPEARLHFLDYWRIIRIRKTVILVVFLLVVLTTTVITYLLPKTYSSTSIIEIGKDVTDIAPLLSGIPGQAGYDPFFIETQSRIILSTSVLDEVVTNLGLAKLYATRYSGADAKPFSLEDSYKTLKKQIELSQTRNTSLIEIRVYDLDPDVARDIANAVVTSYTEFRKSTSLEASKNSIKALGKQAEDETNELSKAQTLVENLRTNLGIAAVIDNGDKNINLLETEVVRNYQDQFLANEQNYRHYASTLENIAKAPQGKLAEALPTAVPNPGLQTMLDELHTALDRYAAKELEWGLENQDRKNTTNLIHQLQTQINDTVAGIVAGLKIQSDTYRDKMLAASNALVLARASESDKLANYRPYFDAVEAVESHRRIYDTIRIRILQEGVDQMLPKSSTVVTVDKAESDPRPVRPVISINIALGVIVGLVMGFGLAFFIEYLDTSVKTIDDVERSLQAPVLGVIPQNVGSLLDEGIDSPHAEAYRVLRTNLLFSRKDPLWTTMTVVSGGAGEGKSTTIFNLAAIFAQNGNRVLLVDSDLRRPSLHKLLNVSNSVGLTNLLLKQNTLEEVVQTTPIPSFHFLPSGKLPSSSLGILNSAQMKEFVQLVKSRYDFVFFDSPPIMGVSDASILASSVDMAILVIQYRKYPQAMTLRAKQMVEKVGGHLLGVVLNNINISQDSYYYYYSGYYYDYYSKHDDEGGSPKKNGETKSGAPSRGGVEIKQKY